MSSSLIARQRAYHPEKSELIDAISLLLEEAYYQKNPPSVKETMRVLESENVTWIVPEKKVGKYLKRQLKTIAVAQDYDDDDDTSVVSAASSKMHEIISAANTSVRKLKESSAPTTRKLLKRGSHSFKRLSQKMHAKANLVKALPRPRVEMNEEAHLLPPLGHDSDIDDVQDMENIFPRDPSIASVQTASSDSELSPVAPEEKKATQSEKPEAAPTTTEEQAAAVSNDESPQPVVADATADENIGSTIALPTDDDDEVSNVSETVEHLLSKDVTLAAEHVYYDNSAEELQKKEAPCFDLCVIS